MKAQKMIFSLLMIVMLFITAALPVAADTILTTNDGTVLVCDDYGNCQIVGQINDESTNKPVVDIPEQHITDKRTVINMVGNIIIGILIYLMGHYIYSHFFIEEGMRDTYVMSVFIRAMGFAITAVTILKLTIFGFNYFF